MIKNIFTYVQPLLYVCLEDYVFFFLINIKQIHNIPQSKQLDAVVSLKIFITKEFFKDNTNSDFY